MEKDETNRYHKALFYPDTDLVMRIKNKEALIRGFRPPIKEVNNLTEEEHINS
jgi:hypothetical protein